MSRYKSNAKMSTKKKVLMVLLIAAVVVTAAFFFLRGCSDSFEDKATSVYLDDDSSSIDGQAQARSREDILKELEKQQLIVTDKLSSHISFPVGKVDTIGEWIVENLEENSIIQQAEVYLDDVLIARTTPIYPNQHITGISLLEEVKTGEYEVIAYLNYYDLDTKEFISKAGYKIRLTIKSSSGIPENNNQHMEDIQ